MKVMGKKENNIELFVVFEGSKDECKKVIREIKENRTENAKIANMMYDEFKIF